MPPDMGEAPSPSTSSKDGDTSRASRIKTLGVIASVVVAVLSLVCSVGFGLHTARTTETQLALMREQIREQAQAGPVLEASAEPWLYVPKSREWTQLDPTENVRRSDDDRGHIVLIVTVTNNGRFQGTVTDVGIGTSATTYVPASKPNCPIDTGVSECKLPLILGPQSEQKFYIDLDSPEMVQKLTCSEYNRERLEYIVATRGSDMIVGRLQKSIYYTTDC